MPTVPTLRIPREEDLRSSLRDPAVAARVGVWLGVCFTVAFLTGLYSHLLQNQPGWFVPLTRPVWIYRLTQGLHYLSGVACVPLLLVKLFTVFPRLFTRPPWGDRRQLLLHGLERASIGALAAAAIFQLATGLANSSQWYPFSFSFRSAHYAVAWVAIGALALHVAVKLPVIREAFAAPLEAGEHTEDDPDEDDPDKDDPDEDDPDTDDADRDDPDGGAARTGLSRRGLIQTTYAAVGLTVLAVAGGSVPGLRRVSVFANHYVPGGGIPINKSAHRAGVTAAATAPDYSLVVVAGERSVTLSLADLSAMTQRTATLPIACVEGWSASGEWTGVPLRDLLDLVDAASGSAVRVRSVQESGPFRSSLLVENVADDPVTLLALRLDGEPLSLDHGFPCRLIAPGRPGVLQTKWVGRLEVQS